MTLNTTAICTKIHKKSQSPSFKDLQVGDQIEFSIEIKQLEEVVEEHMQHIIDALIFGQIK